MNMPPPAHGAFIEGVKIRMVQPLMLPEASVAIVKKS